MSDRPSPIMLCSMARSGSTWIERILDSHPDSFTLHEPDRGYLGNCLVNGRIPLYAEADQLSELGSEVREIVAIMLARRCSDVVGKSPHFPKRYYSGAAYTARVAAIAVAKAAGRLPGARAMSRFAIPDLANIAERPDIRIVWKSINLTGCLGLFARSLPDMREILILRHPCGQIASTIRLAAGTGEKYLGKDRSRHAALTETAKARQYGLTLEKLESSELIERLAWQWAIINEKALDEIKDHSNAMTLVYEELCATPMEKAEELIRFCGMPWDKQVADFVSKSTEPTDSQDYYSVFKTPLTAARRWREQLSEAQIEQVYAIISKTGMAEILARMDAAIAES